MKEGQLLFKNNIDFQPFFFKQILLICIDIAEKFAVFFLDMLLQRTNKDRELLSYT